MRNSVVKKLNKLIPYDVERPDTECKDPLKNMRRWKKRFWNSLNHIQKSKLKKEMVNG